MTNDKDEKQSMTYEKMRVTFSYPVPIRSSCCKACERCKSKGEIKVTSLHHFIYAFTKETVKKNPVLALMNTVETCFGCHKIFDGLRDLLLSSPRGGLRSINRIIQAIRLLPEEQQEHFTKLAREWLRNNV